jgi:CO dehydrogenase maturation factor
MCGAHATVRGFLGELVAKAPDAYDVVVDMEAGLEHLSRGTGKHVSRFLAVVEPYYRSMETARRVAELAAELGISDVGAVLNKVRNQADRDAVASYCASHHMKIVGDIPYDAGLADAERAGQPPLDYSPDSASVAAMRRLAADLVAHAERPL